LGETGQGDVGLIKVNVMIMPLDKSGKKNGYET